MENLEELPAGLWMVKWIDRFYFRSESASVDIALQRLDGHTPLSVRALKPDRIEELLGVPPNSHGRPVHQFECRTIQAGSLPSLNIGDLYEGTSQVGRLPSIARRVSLTSGTRVRNLRVFDQIDAPADWLGKAAFRVLNFFEYPLGGIQGINKATCTVFLHDNVEYILPSTVVFRTFYGFSSRVINALCNGPWPKTVRELISFRQYDSGIRTCESNGDWYVVLEPGIPKELAPRLAHLWFDQFARRQASSLHSNVLKQNEGIRGSDGRRWFSSATIPQEFDDSPLEMTVRGFPLRPFIPSKRDACPKRFLITAITGATWPHSDRVIYWDYHLSNTKGELERPADEAREYHIGKPPVQGNADALIASSLESDARASVNVFQTSDFEFLNEPKMERQKKRESQQFRRSVPSIPDGAALIVSTGNSTYRQDAPAPGDVQTPTGIRSEQFDMLLEALQRLEKERKIDGFQGISPTDRRMEVLRNNIYCWNFLKKEDRLAGAIPKRGWEVIHEKRTDAAALRQGRPAATARPRAALILSVQLGSRKLIIIEIEPRQSTCRLFAFEYYRDIDEARLEEILRRIRKSKGVIPNSNLKATFAGLTDKGIVGLHHGYIHPNGDVNLPAIGIRSDLLIAALWRVLEPIK